MGMGSAAPVACTLLTEDGQFCALGAIGVKPVEPLECVMGRVTYLKGVLMRAGPLVFTVGSFQARYHVK